jgi:hypothetical protein
MGSAHYHVGKRARSRCDLRQRAREETELTAFRGIDGGSSTVIVVDDDDDVKRRKEKKDADLLFISEQKVMDAPLTNSVRIGMHHVQAGSTRGRSLSCVHRDETRLRGANCPMCKFGCSYGVERCLEAGIGSAAALASERVAEF